MIIRNLNKGTIGLLILALLAYSFYFFKNPAYNQPLIVISQIIDHNTLNTVYKGLKDTLENYNSHTKKGVKILYENAHGNYNLSKQIADKFIAINPLVMVGLSTQSAQSFLETSLKKGIPLVFSAVTDPTSAKLEGPTITGVSDFMPPEPQINLFLKLIPHLKKLGVLYNPSEINSVSFLEKFEKEANTKGIILIRAPLNSTAEANTVATSLAGRVDALYFPNDNTTMAAVKSIVAVGFKHAIPVFANDTASVEQGAMAAVSYDRYQMGKTTAEIVIKILEGQSPKDIPVVCDAKTKIVVNQSSLSYLQLTLPVDLKNAEIIE